MEIKEGYGGKTLRIDIVGRDHGVAEIWLIQNGLELSPQYEKYKETLSYASIDELVKLKKEIESALKAMIGLQ